MIFLTGATGFLGREVLRDLVLHERPERIAILARSARRESATARVDALLEDLGLSELLKTKRLPTELHVLEGDLCAERFGLSDYDYSHLVSQTERVIHCAASTSFSLSSQQAFEANVLSTERVLELCRSLNMSQFQRSLMHVSTAYVAGETQATVSAAELDLTRPFRNTYEQSKAEAEARVRQISGDFHTTIVRPSIVVGNSQTGATSAFNVIYGPAKLLVRGLYPVLPGRASTPFDVVPVDYVVRAMLELARRVRPSGQSFHLCAGEGRESTLRELIELLLRAFQGYRRGQGGILHSESLVIPELVQLAFSSWSMASETLKKIERLLVGKFEALSHILYFLPYLHSNPRFDVRCVTTELGQVIPLPPLFKDYATQIFDYCFATNWGRRPLAVVTA